MHPLTPSPPAVDDPAGPRLVLRDGTVATVRRSTPVDRKTMRRFFHHLSAESRRLRFFTAGEPAESLVDRLCDSEDDGRSVTLVAVRQTGSDTHFIAVASYFATAADAAEAAFAVDDRFQGKGLTTELLERLAAVAAGHGFRRFDATTLADNVAMLEVFRDSGFEVRSKSSPGVVEITLSLTPSTAGVVSSETRRRQATAASLRPMLEPRAVAVIGASRDAASIGRRILDALAAAGFAGPLYPINPAATEIAGLNSYASMRDAPAGVDLAVVAVPRAHDRDADELLHEIRGFPLLVGYRGRPAADVDALRDVLLRISRLVDEVPEIVELDLNPVIAFPDGHGCRIVDERIRVSATARH